MKMDPVLVKTIQSYNNHKYECKIGIEIIKEIDQLNTEFNCWLNDLRQKKEEANQEQENVDKQLRELKQKYTTLNSKANNLEKMIEEKKSEIKKLDGLKQQYLIRKEKATARLSETDVDFIDSLEKRLLAFRHLTGVVWDYPNCVEDHLSGYIRNVVSKKIKFFQGKLSPAEIWQLIEKLSK